MGNATYCEKEGGSGGGEEKGLGWVCAESKHVDRVCGEGRSSTTVDTSSREENLGAVQPGGRSQTGAMSIHWCCGAQLCSEVHKD